MDSSTSDKKHSEFMHVAAKIAAIEIVCETIIMFLILPVFEPYVHGLMLNMIDPIILVAVTAPLIAYFVTRPYIIAKIDLIERLEYLSHHDLLTGLDNRRSLMDGIKKNISLSKHQEHRVALILFDLDKFKSVNDTLGHNAGDELLVSVGQRLQEVCGSNDVICRVGGDEFAVLHKETKSGKSSVELANAIINKLSEPHHVLNTQVTIGVSIGIAMIKNDHDNETSAIRDADVALYAAKNSTIRKVVVFDDEILNDSKRIRDIENDIKFMIERHQIYVMYQPVYDIQQDKVVGAELLLRWKHPVYGDISPNFFIPIAERDNYISRLFEYALIHACELLSNDRELMPDDFVVSINVSGQQFAVSDFHHTVSKIVEHYQIDPRQICFEMTESSLVDYKSTIYTVMSDLASEGYRFALDNFGSGYSSILSVYQFNFDYLKIDRHFIKNIANDQRLQHILGAIIDIKEKMGNQIIVEGVEFKEQNQYIKSCNVNYVQGFYYSKPVRLNQLSALLSATRSVFEQ